jgi:hypothetical protein
MDETERHHCRFCDMRTCLQMLSSEAVETIPRYECDGSMTGAALLMDKNECEVRSDCLGLISTRLPTFLRGWLV